MAEEEDLIVRTKYEMAGLSPKIPGTVTTLAPGRFPGIPGTRVPTFQQLVPEIPGTQVPVCPAASAGRSVSGTVYRERLNVSPPVS
jgi:hypothetical protein